jgi:hypothetical protein
MVRRVAGDNSTRYPRKAADRPNGRFGAMQSDGDQLGNKGRIERRTSTTTARVATLLWLTG